MCGYFLKTIKGGNNNKIKILYAKIIDNLAKSVNIIVGLHVQSVKKMHQTSVLLLFIIVVIYSL